MTTQSIIVYRNPLEAAFWESGLLFPLMCAMVAAAIAAVSVDWLLRKIPGGKALAFRRKYGGVIAAWTAILSATATVWVMV